MTRVLTNFPRECVLVLCQNSTSKLDLNLIYLLSELVNHFELLCGIGGYDVSSIGTYVGLF